MSGQVINNFSLNIFGGYSGGVDGMELGGLFNIDKKDAQYFQAAGLFNMVGGNTNGVQLAGISNTVLKSVQGVQASWYQQLCCWIGWGLTGSRHI
jgi:hypothetical protein